MKTRQFNSKYSNKQKIKVVKEIEQSNNETLKLRNQIVIFRHINNEEKNNPHHIKNMI